MLAWFEHTAWETLFRRAAVASLVVHLLAAVFSQGFYHCDEHYQIIELVASKLGITPVSELAWDHAAHIRPWFQAAFYTPFVRGFLALGIREPFTITLLLRLLSALLGWSALVAFARTLPRFFLEDGVARRATLLLVFFFHLVPMLSARTSSENFAQIFLLFALTLLIAPGRLGPSAYPVPGAPPERARWFEPAWCLAGAAFACAFQSRYQAALFVVGAGLWFMLFARERLRLLVGVGSGFLVVSALAVLLDRWGYGYWVYAPWDYYRVNLIEGVAAQFSHDPPWAFFTLFNKKLLPPFGLLWLGIMFVALVALPRHLLTWTVAPFLLVHHAVDHKETRFLFPTLVLALVLAGLLLQRIFALAKRRAYRPSRAVRGSLRAFAFLLFALNLLGLALYAFTPTSPRWTILNRLDELAPNGYTLFTGKGYDAITLCNAKPRFYWGKRNWYPYATHPQLSSHDARGLPAYYAWAGTPLTVHTNPFHAECEELFPKFWVSSPEARSFWSKPFSASLAKGITTYAVYRCPDHSPPAKP
jgi:hypothetical protein